MKRALDDTPGGPALSQEELKRQQRAERLRQWQAAKKAQPAGAEPLARATTPADEQAAGAAGASAHRPPSAAVRVAPLGRLGGGARGRAPLGSAGGFGGAFGGGGAEGGAPDRPRIQMHALHDNGDDDGGADGGAGGDVGGARAMATATRNGKRAQPGAAADVDADDEDEGDGDDARARPRDPGRAERDARNGGGGGGGGGDGVGGADDVDPLDAYMSAIAPVDAGRAVRTLDDARREAAGDASSQAISLDEIFAGAAGHGSFVANGGGPRGLGFDDVMTDSAPTDHSGDEAAEARAGARAPARRRTDVALARKAMAAATAAAAADAADEPALGDDDFHAAFVAAMRAGANGDAGARGGGEASVDADGGGRAGARAAGGERAGGRRAGPERFFADDDDASDDDLGLGGADGGLVDADDDGRRGGAGGAGGSDDDAAAADAALGAKRRKELPPVDHSTISYAPFRKALFTESAGARALSDEQVAELRTRLELRVHGRKCPRPVTRWTEAGLSDPVLKALERHGYAAPFAIQAQALPALMSGRDVIGIAKTGSGKTVAYVLPMLRHALDQPPLQPGDGPIGLVMVPTRELAAQVYREALRFAKASGAAVACIYGGAGVKQQICALKRGAEIVVCTPGRMIDMLTANGGRVTNLRRVTFVVLDEADRMFDLGFEPQISRVLANVRPDRQVALFSATFPRAVDALARAMLVKPLQLIVGGVSVVSSTIEQHVEVLGADGKYERLCELLDDFLKRGQVLVFVATHEASDRLFRQLAHSRYPAIAIHGRMDQADRDGAIADFKSGAAPLMVATSVAARGLDVRELLAVVNYDVPSHYEDYVHRVGRVGRAGRKGWAFTFLAPDEEKFAPDLVRALELAHHEVPDDLAVLANTFEDKRKAGITGQAGKKTGFRKSGHKGLALDQASLDAQTAKDRKARRMKLRAEGFEVSASDDSDGGVGLDSDDDGRQRAARAPAPRVGAGLPVAPPPPGAVAALAPNAAGGALGAPPPVQSTQPLPSDAAASIAAAASHAALAVAARLGLDPVLSARHAAERAAQALAAGAPGGLQPARAAGGALGSHAEQLAAAQQRAHLAAAHVATMLGHGAGAGAGALQPLPMPTGGAPSGGFSLPAPPPPPPGMVVPASGAGGASAGASRAGAKKWLSAEIEINDYPKTARWKVTHREALLAITEWTRAAITTKGVYTPPGQKPPAGERKLFLLIEAEDAAQLKEAKQEVKRILEETSAYAAPDERPQGRYTV
ncbi:hypothetical protein KFE25_001661 [Diacronema lutheri]|uniref:RNA helicase n=1 Tax=Diacronema lutheri TaxID=2081491 RepID=A0A8J5XAG0_DIALT|nr:hypothetical protein KFE25_001661 [Diacronema lutheri]